MRSGEREDELHELVRESIYGQQGVATTSKRHDHDLHTASDLCIEEMDFSLG
jgi:hypothetical protein